MQHWIISDFNYCWDSFSILMKLRCRKIRKELVAIVKPIRKNHILHRGIQMTLDSKTKMRPRHLVFCMICAWDQTFQKMSWDIWKTSRDLDIETESTSVGNNMSEDNNRDWWSNVHYITRGIMYILYVYFRFLQCYSFMMASSSEPMASCSREE